MNISAFNPQYTLKNNFLLFLASLILLISFDVIAANIESEKRWAEQLRDNIVIGEAVDIPSSDSTFFSIYTEHSTATAKGAVILMHGTGAHPDWGDIINPLRSELPDKGWSSLSIQLPLAFAEKKDAESLKQVIESSIPRIEASIKFLKDKKYHHIVLISHSFGTLMALNYLQLKGNDINPDKSPVISAAIIIGTPSSGSTAPLNSPIMIEAVKIPLLDIYGSNDLDSVLNSAKARKSAANKSGNKKYRQVESIGANHFYHGLDEELVTYIYHWLSKTFTP